MPNEGDIVRNKRTGEEAVWRGGRPVPMGGGASAATPGIIRGPAKVAPQPTPIDLEKLEIEKERLRIAQADEARNAAEDSDKLDKFGRSKTTALDSMGRVFGQLTDVAKAARDGWATTGRGGALVRGLPTAMSAGSDAYDLQRLIDTVDAKAAFDALAEMRQNSPTGGALGNVTERELDLLKASVASLDPNQSKEQLMQNIVKAKKVYVGMMRRIDPEAAGKYMRPAGTKPGTKTAPKRLKYNPATGELE